MSAAASLRPSPGAAASLPDWRVWSTRLPVRGFGREAEAYERSRPSYPPEAVAWLVHHLGIRPGAVVADLAAGTGKFTRLLMPTGATVLAIEPVSESPGLCHALPAIRDGLPYATVAVLGAGLSESAARNQPAGRSSVRGFPTRWSARRFRTRRPQRFLAPFLSDGRCSQP